MFPIRITTFYEEHPDLSKRKLKEVQRASMQAMGDCWAQELLPEHFRPSAFRAFGYQNRTAKYNFVKDKLHRLGATDKRSGLKIIAGSETPLVYTGRLRAALLSSAPNNVRAYPSRVTITLSAPGLPYFTLRPFVERGKARSTMLIAREVLLINDVHRRRLGVAAERGYVSKLNELRRSGALRKVVRPRAA